MLGSLAEGTTRVEGFLQGEDSLNTIAAFRAMGVDIDIRRGAFLGIGCDDDPCRISTLQPESAGRSRGNT